MAQHVTRPRGGRFVAPPEVGGSLPVPIQQALRLLATGKAVPAKVVNKLRRDALRLDLSPIDRAYLFAQIGLIGSGHGNPALDWVAIRDFRMAVKHAAEGDPQRPHYLLMLADGGPAARSVRELSQIPGSYR